MVFLSESLTDSNSEANAVILAPLSGMSPSELVQVLVECELLGEL